MSIDSNLEVQNYYPFKISVKDNVLSSITGSKMELCRNCWNSEEFVTIKVGELLAIQILSI